MIWDYSKGACTMRLTGHTEPVRALCWNWEIPFILLTGSWDSTIKVYDIRDGRCLETLNYHSSDVYGLTSHASRPFLIASSSRDSTIRLFDISHLATNILINIILKKSWTESMITGVNEYELKGLIEKKTIFLYSRVRNF